MTRLAWRGQQAFDESEIIPADTGSSVGVWRNVVVAPREEPADWLTDALSSLERLRSLGQNWDSYGAAPVHSDSVEIGGDFARRIAHFVGVPAPVVTATPDGDVGFCWDTGDWSLDMSIDPTGLVSYVFLDETNPQRERESRTRDFSQLVAYLTCW